MVDEENCWFRPSSRARRRIAASAIEPDVLIRTRRASIHGPGSATRVVGFAEVDVRDLELGAGGAYILANRPHQRLTGCIVAEERMKPVCIRASVSSRETGYLFSPSAIRARRRASVVAVETLRRT